MVRMRAPLSLVAVLVAIALVAGILIGGQIWRGRSAAPAPAPAGQVPLSALEKLEARALRVPTFKSVLDCTSGPYGQDGALGSGPLYGDSGGAVRTQWGEFFYNVFYTDTVIGGPILVRAKDVYKNEPVALAGQFAGGPVIGSDNIDGRSYQLHTELVLYEAQALPSALPGWASNTHRFTWDFLAGIPKAGSGGSGWQIDGAGFTETFLFC
jgi:hypothetical protein